MSTPSTAISYRRRLLWRESSALNPAHVDAVPVSLGRPPSLHGLRRTLRRTSRVILPSNFRSWIFSLGWPPHGPLFARFPGTTGTSDFPESYIDGVRLSASRRGPDAQPRDRATRGSPDSRAWCVGTCPGSPTARGSHAPRERLTAQGMLPSSVLHRVGTPEWVFRGSIARPALPPTSNASAGSSRSPPHDGGRSGSLLLLRERLSLFTPCRF